MNLQKQSIAIVTKYSEMDRRRWVVRYIILVAIGIILVLKVYSLLFIDYVVGIYSILTTFVLFSYIFFAYIKYRDPYLDAQNIALDKMDGTIPFVSIIVAVKNEECNIQNCVQSCINSTYANKEVIVVDDGKYRQNGCNS